MAGAGKPAWGSAARDSVDQRVEALVIGVHDYLVKPFGVGEPLARKRAGAAAPAGLAVQVVFKLAVEQHPRCHVPAVQ